MRFRLPHAAMSILLALSAFPSHAQSETITTPVQRTPTPAQVIGSQYRPVIEKVLRASARQDFQRALELVQPVVAFCDGLLGQGRKLVSVADAGEYVTYVAESGDGQPVDWIDMACPEAYHAQAYVDVELKRPDAAFAALDKAILLAPYWIDPLTERGHLFNTTGRPAQGLACYREALALIERHPTNQAMHALVLRGIGFSLTDIGDLDAAEQAYRRSLEMDPYSALAVRELEYIKQQRAKATAKP